ncbi:MAG: glycosyltransferase [Bacilli bacterium]|nr:glycosyltransferase [Bacilli bacterium]
MKVLNILTSRLNYNGIGMSLLNYYNNINNKDIQLDYLVPNVVEDKLKKQFTTKKNNIFEFDYHGKKLHQRRPLLFCLKLYKLLKKEHYDIVHVHGSSSLMFLQLLTAKIAGVKVRIAHSRNTETDHKLINKLFRPLFNISYNVAFSCGKEAGEWLFGKNKKFILVPNGKNSKMFSYNEESRKKYRKKYNLDNKIVLGHIGNFNYQKNHEFLIKVFNQLYKKNNNYFLILAGSGELEDKIKSMAIEMNIESNILFLGQIPVEQVAELLNAMDIMLFPSRFEGFPNVLIEWQMNGLPCVISDKITKDVKVTDLVYFESIDSCKKWVDKVENIKLIDRSIYKKTIINEIKTSGYDIEENAKMLEHEYIKLYNNAK